MRRHAAAPSQASSEHRHAVGATHEVGARPGLAMPDIGKPLALTRPTARECGLHPPAA